MEFEIRTEGLTDFEVRVRAIGEDYRDQIIGAVKKATVEAGTYMAAHVPFHSGALFRAIEIGPVVYHPGGAGGGGFYEAHVGVNEEIAPHAIFVVEGTGIYGPQQSMIYPAKGNVMVFEKGGEGSVFTKSSKGQEPRSAWFEVAQEVAEAVIRREA
jgi:hypothetical protein